MNVDHYLNPTTGLVEHLYQIYVEPSVGLRLKRFSSNGSEVQTVIIDANGTDGSVVVDSSAAPSVYICYRRPGTAPITREFVVKKFPLTDITTETWSSTYQFGSPLDGSHPRLYLAGTPTKNPNVVYTDQGKKVVNLVFNVSTGLITKRTELKGLIGTLVNGTLVESVTFFTNDHPQELVARGFGLNVYMAFPDNVGATSFTVMKINGRTSLRLWNKSFDLGNTSSIKSGFRIVEDTANSLLYVYSHSGTQRRVLAINPSNGNQVWISPDLSPELSSSYGTDIHGFEMFLDTPAIQTVLTTGSIKTFKISPFDGSRGASRTTSLTGFTNAGPNMEVILPFPGEKLYIPRIRSSDSIGVVHYQSTTSTKQIVYPSSETGSNQLVTDSGFAKSYLIYRNNTLSEVRLAVIGADNTLIGDFLIDANGGQLPSISLSGSRIVLSCFDFYTNFTEYVRLKVFQVRTSTPGSIEWNSTLDLGDSSVTNIHPALAMTSSSASLCLKRFDGRVSGYAFKVSDGTLSKSVRDLGLRISSKLGHGTSGSSVYLTGVKFGDSKKVVAGLVGISSLSLSSPVETDIKSSGVDKIETYITGSSSRTFIGAYGTDGNLYIESLSSGVSLWAKDSEITDELGDRISGFSAFEDNLLIFTRNSSSGSLKTYKYGLTGQMSFTTLTPYFPAGSTTLPPTGSNLGTTLIHSVFPYDKYVVVSKTSNTAGPVRISEPNISVLHGNYRYTATFTNSANILTITTTVPHGLLVDDFISVDFASGSMIDGNFRVTAVNSLTVFQVDYDRSGIASGSLTFYKIDYALPTLTDLTEYQTALHQGFRLVSYYDQTEKKLVLKKISDSVTSTLLFKNVDSVGQLPSILASGNNLFISFVVQRRSLTDVLYLHVKRVALDTLAQTWSVSSRYFPDSDETFFRTRIVETTDKVVVFHFRENRVLYGNPIILSNGSLNALQTTSYSLPSTVSVLDTSLKSLPGTPPRVEFIYPSETEIQVITFDPETLAEGINQTYDGGDSLGTKTRVRSQPGSSNTTRYLLFQSGVNSGVVRFNPQSGAVLWQRQYPILHPISNLYEYLGYVLLFAISSTGNLVSVKLVSDSGATVPGATKSIPLLSYPFTTIVGTPILYSTADWGRMSLFFRNSVSGGFPTITLNEFIEANVYFSGATEATVTNTVSELTEYQSVPQPVMILEGGTYTQTENIVTVQYPNHGILLNARVGLRFTSGNASGGTYEVIIRDNNSFKVMVGESRTTSGSVTISVFDNFFTCYYTDAENGIEMTKFVSDGGQYQVSIDPLGQFPSLLHDPSQTNFIYVSYVKNVTSFVDYVKLVFKRVNTFDLSDDWVSGVMYMDTSSVTFRPRMAVRGQNLYIAYCRHDNTVNVTILDKISGTLSSNLNTGLTLTDSTRLEILGDSASDTLFLGYTNSTKVFIRKLSPTGGSLWTTEFDGGDTGLKQNLAIRESLGGVIASYNSGTGVFLTRLKPDGTLHWTTDVSESDAYGNKEHGFYTLSGTPLVFFVVPRIANPNLADLVCKKYDLNGTLTTTRTTFLETFDGKLVVGPPLVFSRSYVDPFVGAGNVFNSLWMVYPDPTGPLYPNWVILVNRLEVSPTPIINSSLVQTTDNQYTRDPVTGMFYTTYVDDPGTNGVYLNRMREDGITDIIRKVDFGGYGAVISVNEDSIYLAYTKNVLTYTDYITIEIRKYTKSDLTFVWGVTRTFTDNLYQFFFPRIRVQGDNLFLAYTDQTGTLTVDRCSAATGSLIDSMPTGYTLTASELGELSTWASENYFYLSLPQPSSNLLRLQKYGVVEDSLTRLYSSTFDGGVTGQKSGILLRTPGDDLYPHGEDLLVGFTNNGSQYLVSKISSTSTSGIPEWTTSLGTISGIFTQKILGMGVYGDYSQIFLMKDTGGSISIESRKLSPTGVIVQTNSTTTPLNTADISTSVNGGTPVTIQVSPVIFFNRDWSTIYIEFYVRAAIPFGEQVSPYDRLVVTALSASLTYSITLPVSELSTNQFAKPSADEVTDTFLVYSHETEGVKISKVDSSGTVLQTRVVDPNGQSPTLTILGSSVYVSYVFQQFGFLNSIYHRIVCYDLELDDRTLISEYVYPETNTASFRPRISSFGQGVVTHYSRENNQIIMETVSTASPPTKSLIPLTGEVFGGTDYLRLSNTFDGKVYLLYPTNSLETEYRFLRLEVDGTSLWTETLTHTSGISPLMRIDESGFIKVYYDEGSGFRFRNYDKETGVENWNSLQTIPNLVAGEVSNVYVVLGYILIFGLLTSPSNTFIARKLNDDGEFVNTFNTDLTGIVSTSDIDGRIVILSDNPWDTLYYAHYTTNSGLGSIPVSTTRFIEVSAHILPPTRPLPIPASELSEYQVAESTDHIFLVQSDQVNGLAVLRVEKASNNVTHTFTLPIADYAFAPSITILDDVLLLTHVEYVTTFTEFVYVSVSVLNSSNLSLVSSDIQGFPDPLPGTFRPRTCVTNNFLHIGLVRFNREVYVLPFDRSTRTFGNLLETNLTTGTVSPYIDPLSLGMVSTSDTVTLVLPDLDKNISVSRYEEEYDSIQNTYFVPTPSWTLTFDGGDTDPKARPKLRVDSSGLIYLAYNLLSQLTPQGTVSWTMSLTGTGTKVSDTPAHGFHLFQEYPLVQTILSSNNVVFGKFNELGEQWSSRTTPLVGINSSNISGTPVVVSYYPYTRTHILYQSTNTSLYNVSGRNLVFQTSTVSPVFVKPIPANKNIEGYQATTFLDGSANSVYYTPTSGSRVYYFNGTNLSLSTTLSFNGIYPSISKFQNEVTNHVEYVESTNAFTEYQLLNLKEINGVTLDNGWSQQQVLPYHIPPISIVRTSFNYIAVLVLKDNKYVNIQLRDKTTGDLISTYTSYTPVLRTEDVRIMGQDDIYVSFPEASPEGTGIRVMRFDANGLISLRWSVLLENDLNDKYHVRLTQNLTGRVFVSYIGKIPSETLGFLKLLTISRVDGTVERSKTLFTDMATTERINGLDNEGSFVNVSRLGLQLLDTDNTTFDLIVKNESYLGTRSRTFEEILTGFPAYVDNPLVIYNQGDGWAILVYEDTFGTFRMVRTPVEGGANRIDYTPDGKVDYNVSGKSPQTSSVEYPYYWRPRITINPEVYPSNKRESTLISGKITGLFREWWNNGHLKTSMNYSASTSATFLHTPNIIKVVSSVDHGFSSGDTAYINFLTTDLEDKNFNVLAVNSSKEFLIDYGKRLTKKGQLKFSLNDPTPSFQPANFTFDSTNPDILITVDSNHGLRLNNLVLIKFSTTGMVDGTYTVTSVPSSKTFRIGYNEKIITKGRLSLPGKTATFNKNLNTLVVTCSGNHDLVASNTVALNFTSSSMTDGNFQVVAVNSPSVFLVHYTGTAIASGSVVLPTKSGSFAYTPTMLSITTSGGHGLSVGNSTFLKFVSGGAIDGNFQVVAVVSPVTFMVAYTGSIPNQGTLNIGSKEGTYRKISDVLTVTSAVNHGLFLNNTVSADFASPSMTDDDFSVIAVVSPTVFLIHYNQTSTVNSGSLTFSVKAQFITKTNTLTVTSTANHGLSLNNTISADFTSTSMTDGDFSVIAVVSPTVFLIHYNQTSTDNSGSLTFSAEASFVNDSNTLTVTSAVNHGLSLNNTISADFASPSMTDGDFSIVSVISPTSFLIIPDNRVIGSENLQYLSGNTTIGRHVDFERTGQYRLEVTSYVGPGQKLREWKPPTETNLSALFKEYDTNNDGFLSSSELNTLIEEYGGFDFATEDQQIIFADFDRNGDGKISRQEFISRFGSNPYTRDIPFKDLQHSVLVLEADLVDGRKTGALTEYHPFRPEKVLRVSSTTDSLGRLHGLYTEYYYDGTTQKLVVTYNQGQKSGTQTERYPPDLGGGVSRVTVYSSGVQSNDIKEYFPSGSYKSIYEPFTDPSDPNTAFRYTEYFDKTTAPPNLNTEINIRRRYFLDNFRLKNGLENFYSSPGVLQTGWPKTYVRGVPS